MNKDELVGYIQGLLDMSKRSNEIVDCGEDLSKVESELLGLINKALIKHKNSLNGEINHFNKRADEYATPIEKRGPQISNHGEFGKK
jgi:hypothetical protein